jgi:glycosyltransferase involved in cell wall biosynthesis
MRVLTVGNMYPPHHLGGYEVMWRSAVRHLREWGHEVRVLTTDYQAPTIDPSTPEDEHVFRELRWYWHDHDFPRLAPRARFQLERHNAAVFARQAERFRPDGISWWAMGGMSLSLLGQAGRAGIPASAVVVDDWLLYGPKVDAWSRMAHRWGPLRPALSRLAGVPAGVELEAVGRWLFASRTLLHRARDAGRHVGQADVSYPGIDHELFHGPRTDRSPWRWRLLYCGRIDERKGIELAVEALGHLPGEATLTVIGAGDERHRRQLAALAGSLGAERRVHIERRPRNQLPRSYAEADVTLFPVRWEEPFGLAPLESMAMGTPVVASGRGGSGEYLEHGENCLLFDVDAGSRSLAQAIQRLAGDPDLRRRIHRAGLATAARFHDDDFDRAVERSLMSAVGNRAPRGATT